MTGRTPADVAAAMHHARAELSAGAASGIRGRIWLIRAHMIPSESAAWNSQLLQARTEGASVTAIPAGTATLYRIQP